VAVFGGPLDDRWGDFVSSAAFVPFCHEMILHLAGRSTAGLRSYAVGARVTVEHETSRWPTVVHVTSPGAVAAERLLPGATPGKLTYWKTDVPGYYAVDFEQQDRTWRSGFAVNTGPEESRLERVPWEQLQSSISAREMELVEDARWLGEGGGGSGGSHEWTPWVALAVLGVLVAENFLANRFYGHSQTHPTPENGSSAQE
jgi:hypothetical protein